MAIKQFSFDFTCRISTLIYMTYSVLRGRRSVRPLELGNNRELHLFRTQSP